MGLISKNQVKKEARNCSAVRTRSPSGYETKNLTRCGGLFSKVNRAGTFEEDKLEEGKGIWQHLRKRYSPIKLKSRLCGNAKKVDRSKLKKGRFWKGWDLGYATPWVRVHRRLGESAK